MKFCIKKQLANWNRIVMASFENMSFPKIRLLTIKKPVS